MKEEEKEKRRQIKRRKARETRSAGGTGTDSGAVRVSERFSFPNPVSGRLAVFIAQHFGKFVRSFLSFFVPGAIICLSTNLCNYV